MRLDACYDRPPGGPDLPLPTVQAAAERAAARFGSPVEHVEALSGGFSNHNHRVTLASGDRFVIRSTTRDATAVQTEIDVMNAVRGAVPVPEPWWSDLRDGPWRHVALAWMPGERLDVVEDALPPEDLETVVVDLGRNLARVGAHELGAAGMLGPGPIVATPFDNAGRSAERYLRGAIADPVLQRRLGPITTAALVHTVERHVDWLHDDRTGLVHSDFNAKNLLVGAGPDGWHVTAILDWEFAYAGGPLADLGNFLRFEGEAPSAKPDWISRGFVEGGGHIGPIWRERALFMDLLALCSFLRRPADQPRTHATARRRLHAALDRLI